MYVNLESGRILSATLRLLGKKFKLRVVEDAAMLLEFLSSFRKS